MRISFDEARRDDRYFFYLFVNSDGTWGARMKRYPGDSFDVYETTRHGTDKRHLYVDDEPYRKSYMVDESIKAKLIDKMKVWGLEATATLPAPPPEPEPAPTPPPKPNPPAPIPGRPGRPIHTPQSIGSNR